MSEARDPADTQSPVKRALLEIRDLRARLDRLEREKREPIAIIGMGCRFPGGASDPAAFWRLLQSGQDAIIEVPRARWDIDALYDPDPDAPGKMSTRWGGFLTEAADEFDPGFFGISPREAASMDPQQRLVLEVCWEALEHAGQAPAKLAGSATGVFIGISANDYAELLKNADPRTIDAYVASGTSHSVASGRVSYTLGLQGPSVSVDTACSSSLVAVHLACLSLRTGGCRLALAGGVNLMLLAENTIALSKSRMMAPDGRCKTFDAAADGFVRGEGCGIVLLKRLSDAQADGDRIVAVIRGTASNQDGRSSGLTAPSGLAQEAVIRAALADGAVEPGDVSYLEAHGTGTSLGDPIEVRALAAVLGAGRAVGQPLMIGSVKTNIGHLESAAGVAGLIKVVLALEHGEIPPHLHLTRPNPYIAWPELPVTVPTRLTRWPEGRRLAGVSSFGFSGTNAHVVLEAAPVVTSAAAVAPEGGRGLHVLTVSAKTEAALQELAGRYAAHLGEHPEQGLGDVCFTANAGRGHFGHRAAMQGATAAQLRELLTELAAGRPAAGVARGELLPGQRPRIAFLFTGQGAQYAGMGRELYETQPTFRRALERCAEGLRGELAEPLLSVLYPATGDSAGLDDTTYTQPALFAVEWALAEMWRGWGVEPTLVLGHSVGEYVAACVAGVMSVEAGLKLIAARARLMGALPAGGTMAAVMASEERVARSVAAHAGAVGIAAMNGPEQVVVSGQATAVEAVLGELERDGIKVRRLTVSHAFHSPLMEPMLAAFEAVACGVEYAAPRIGFVSNVTGEMLRPGAGLDAAYWRRHVRAPVQFAAGMRALHGQGCTAYLEIGPTPTLLALGRACVPEGAAPWVASLRPGRADWAQVLESLAVLYTRDAPVDWAAFDRGAARRRVVLPTYPFQRERHWIERGSRRSTASGHRTRSAHPLLGERLRTPSPTFEQELAADAPGVLAGRRVHGHALVPAAAFVEMARAAAAAALRTDAIAIEGLRVRGGLVLPADGRRTVQSIVTLESAERAAFKLFVLDEEASEGPEAWRLLVSGQARVGSDLTREGSEGRDALEGIRLRCEREVPPDELYRQLSDRGIQLGPACRSLVEIWQGKDEALGRVRLAESLAGEAGAYGLHPALLDGALQLAEAALRADATGIDPADTYLPVGVESFALLRGGVATAVWAHAVRCPGTDGPPDTIAADLRLLDDSGAVVAEVKGLRLARVDEGTLTAWSGKGLEDWLYEVAWQPRDRTGGHPEAAALGDRLAPRPIGEQVLPALDRLGAQHGLDLYEELFPAMEALSTAWMLEAFRRLGWELRPGERVSVDALAARMRVADRHRRLLGRMVEMLAEDGLLVKADAGWEVTRRPDPGDPARQARALLERYPRGAAELTLTARCGAELARVLRGEVDPLDLLFPGGSLDGAEKLYAETPSALVFNDLVGEVVAAAAERLPVGRPLRILEVGAGTGGTTASVLPRLSPAQTDYVFTDVSPLFAARATEKFAAYPFVRYAVLDVEREPASQGLDEAFDLIIAANVVHATRDLRAALRHIRQLLAPGGLVVLLEVVRPQRSIDLTFGLTDGWWRFADVDLRPSHPLLSRGQWRSVLEDTGFTDTTALPGDEAESGARPQQAVILARGPEPGASVDPASPGEASAWLILADAAGIGHRLAASLAARGEDCVIVDRGDRFAAVATGRFRANPGLATDLRALVREAVTVPGRRCRGVVDLWGLDLEGPSAVAGGGREGQDVLGCGGALHLVQALATAGWTHSPRLWLVTRGAQAIGPQGDALAPAQAPVWGLGSVIALEHPDLRCVRVDLDPAVALDAAAAALLAEIQAPDREDMVAFRDARRYVARLIRSGRAASDSAAATTPLRLPADATYLITGGLAGLGLLVAQWMVEHGARHLVLMARSQPSDDARETIGGLERAGARVMVVQADVSREAQVAATLAEAVASMPALRGVVHSAGVLDDGVLLQQTCERFAGVMAPKVQGAWNLHRLTERMPLDFFVLFSSASAMLGSSGQGNHAAANAYLDALAHHRRARGLPAVSINWGIWAEIGAAARRNVGARVAQLGLGTIAPDEGLRLLELALRRDAAQIVAIPIQWPRFLEPLGATGRAPLFDEFAAEARVVSRVEVAAPPDLLRRLEETSPNKRRALVLGFVRERALKVMRLEADHPLDQRRPLTELGLDSLMALELRNLLGAGLGLRRALPATLAFDHPTLEALTEYLAVDVLGLEDESADVGAERAGAADDEGADLLGRIEQLSEDEVERLFRERER